MLTIFYFGKSLRASAFLVEGHFEDRTVPAAIRREHSSGIMPNKQSKAEHHPFHSSMWLSAEPIHPMLKMCMELLEYVANLSRLKNKAFSLHPSRWLFALIGLISTSIDP